MTIAYVLCATKSGMENTVLSALKSESVICEVYIVYGEYDLIVKVKVASPDELREFMTVTLRNIPEIERTTTLISI